MEKEIRVRFAPSPTGPLHIGGVRTALYNYLFAKQNKGTFILRIEDTDQTRFVEGAEEYIIESLNWLGIRFDEGVHCGGKYAPYRQSDRKQIYKQYAQKLIDSGNAYYAFDTPEQLDNLRKEAEQKKQNFQYDYSTRLNLINSLTLSKQETEKKIDEGEHYVIRFKIPENENILFHDLIRGEVKVHTSTLDDKVLFKSDGMPTYHLANVVDDYLMQISHVIRGEEWLPSAPLHYLLYDKMGWLDKIPQFAHLPLLLKPDGNGKLSKRDGDRLGFPVFPIDWIDPKTKEKSSGYRESGYFAEAVINILALLGWHPENNQEIFSIDELINEFSIDRINKAGAKFDLEKAKWFNHHYIQTQNELDIANLLNPILENSGYIIDNEKLINIIHLVKDRAYFLKDFLSLTSYFFEAPTKYDEQVIKKRWKEDTNQNLSNIVDILQNIENFNRDNAHDMVMEYINQNELNIGQIMNCIRLSIVGTSTGPDLFEIIALIGKNETVSRLNRAISTIKIV